MIWIMRTKPIRPDVLRLFAAARELMPNRISDYADLCRHLVISDQTMTNWKTRGIPKAKIDALAKAVGCDAEWLRSGKGHMTPANVEDGPDLRGTVPLISWVQAGMWQEAIDNLPVGQGERVATTYRPKQHTYALRVRGDSMEPKFPDGCTIIVEPDESPQIGQYVIVRQGDGEATFKQLVQDGARLYLKPINSRYPILELKEDAIFCGVVKKMEMDV